MAIWMVSYDLRAPGRNYAELYKQLRSVPFAHILESVWLIEADGPASRIRDVLKGRLDPDDRIVVVEFTEDADWAVRNINKPSSDWIVEKRR